MSKGEFFVFAENKEADMVQLPVTTISLGENNIGSIGPEGLPEETMHAITAANASPEFARKPTNRWICVDGRLSAEEKQQALDSPEADPQTSGGIVISEAAGFYMEKLQTQPLSRTIAVKTRENVRDGIAVTVHGDEHAGKAGCGANKKLCDREALRFNAANASVVAPRAWAVMEKLGVASLLTQDDVTDAIETGKANADNDALWDVAPAEVADIIIDNGGEYVQLLGAHQEKKTRIDLDEETAFAKAAFVEALSADEEIEQFAASLGVYKKTAFDRAARQGQAEREAALQVLRVVLFNISICKNLGSKELDADLVG